MSSLPVKTALMLGAVASSSVIWASSPAQALTITHNGTNYDVTTRTGTFGSLASILSQQPWWVSDPNDVTALTTAKSLAESLAGQVGNSFGLPNVPVTDLSSFQPSGPFPDGAFNEGAYWAIYQDGDTVFEINFDGDNNSVEEDEIELESTIAYLKNADGSPNQELAQDIEFVFAVVEPTASTSVPTPALLPAMLGMGASIIRKRKKQEEASA